MLQTGCLLAGRFRIVRALAGQGEVYAAEDMLLRTPVALRRLPPLDDTLRREIQLARRLTHPNIVRVFELVPAEDADFLSLELLDGETLAQRLTRNESLSPEQARTIGSQLLQAIQAAHDAGIHHGALSAQQVMLTTDAAGSLRTVLTGFAYTGDPHQDHAALDAILAQLGVRREQLRTTPGYATKPGKRAWPLLAACAAILLAAVFREELFTAPWPDRAARWYADGETAIADGAYAKAEALFTEALKLSPDFAAARSRLAEALQESDQRDRAREELLKALDGRTRGRAERLLREATQYALTGDWTRAIAAARRRASTMGDSMSAGDIARLLERAGRLDEARTEYQRLLERFPGQPGPMLQYARLLVANRQQKEALRWLDDSERLYRALQNTEGLATVELERARLTQHVGQSLTHARQAAALAESVSSQSLLIRARLLEAVRYAAGGDLPQSESMAREAVALAEQNSLGAVAAEGLNDLAEVIFTQLKYEEAAKLLEQARAIAQRFSAKRTEADVLLRMGRVFAPMNQEQRGRQALEALEKAEAFFRQSGDRAKVALAIQRRADVFRRQGRLPEARGQYRAALLESETDSGRNAARTGLAVVYTAEGNYQEAANLLLAVVDYYRKTSNKLLAHSYLLRYAQNLRLLGRFDESAAIVRGILDETPATPEIAAQCEADLGAIDFANRKFDTAFTRLERLASQARKQERKAVYNQRRYDLCMKYASAHYTQKAQRLCTEIEPVERADPRRHLDVLDALAMAALQQRNHARAVRLASESVRLGIEANAREPVFFSLMLLTRAHHGAKDPQWLATRARTEAALRAWEEQAGKQAVAQSLSRWFIAEHWDAVRNLQ